MKIILGSLLVLLTIPSLGFAQINDCDTRTPTTPAVILSAGTATFSLCWNAKDKSGAIVPVGTETWFKIDNGVEEQLPTATRSAAASTTKQEFLFSWPMTFPKTNVLHAYNAKVCISDGIGGTVCATSTNPVTITAVRGQGPNTPDGGRIQ